MNISNRYLTVSLFTFFLSSFSHTAFANDLNIEIESRQTIDAKGRLHLVFSKSADREPRNYSAWPTRNIEPLFSKDLENIPANEAMQVNFNDAGFPYRSLQDLPPGNWFVQVIYDTDAFDSRINSPGNYYSEVQKVELDFLDSKVLSFNLSKKLPPETLPAEQEHLKFVKMPSELLTEFWQHDMYLRAGVILPKDYYSQPNKVFPVVFSIGGYHGRYDRAERTFNNKDFQTYWFGDDAPNMVLVFLDGEAPLGDSYQIDSANNGPYGEATWTELLPYLTKQFRLVDSGETRFTTGCSTGGWVSLALQLFYPDMFNGAWSFSADGVDFRYFQLVDIYKDENAFINEHGVERPSFRAKDGEVIFSIQREIMMENTMGRNDSFAYSGGQWGGWNAVYGPRLDSGQPSVLWDPITGEIDKEVAQAWSRYDLRKYTEDNWASLGPKVAGKLHIWMGDMDNFYLNNAMKLYEEMLSNQTQPISDAKFTWVDGAGHCDYRAIPMLQETLSQMHDRVPEMYRTK
jgi:hypothetical protein